MGTTLEIIEWFDSTGEQIIQRFPESGATDIKIGAQLIVRESQAAVFFRDGKTLDIFGPGRHTLTTLNLPILTKILSLPFGFKSPFRAEVIFVNMKAFINQKWGTANPVTFRDSVFQMIRLRAFGIFSIKIEDPMLFVNKIVGTQGIYTTANLSDYLKEIIVARFNDIMGETIQTLLDLPKYYDELAAGLKGKISLDFKKSGIELTDLLINAITPTEEVQKMIDERSGMGAVGDLNAYLKFKAAKAMEAAASNPAEGGVAGAGIGMGMGAGLGFMFPGMIKDAVQQSSQAPQNQNILFCSKCGKPLENDAKFCANCGIKIENVPKICPNCKTQNDQIANFCSNCGTKF